MDSHNSATDGVVSTSSSSNASTPNYSYAEYYTNNYKCNQSVVSDWSDFGSPRSIGSSCDNESSKTLDLCPYSPSEQIAQFHLSNNHNSINSSSSNQHQNNSHVTSNNSVSSPGSSNSSCGSSNQLSSAGQISQRASSSLSNFSSSSNHSYSGALALHSSSIASSTASICSASSTNADRSSSVISKPRFGQLNCFFNGSASSSNSNAISVNSHHNLISSHHRNSDEEKISGLNRRVDSPADSGIESGKEGNSATSVCSSPRSDSEDHHQPQVSQTSQGQIQNSNNISTSSNVISSHHNNGSIDDMPMLKRALQAPPLLNTSSLLMDEAYRHHKKFRATKMQQAQRELEAQSPQSSSQTNLSTHDELVQQHQSLASTHSTLVKTLQQQPRFANEQQLKRTDLIHTIIMRGESGLNSKFNVLENNSYSADSSSLISSQMSSTSVTRSSIIHTTSSSQSTLQQLLAPKSQQPSSSIYSNGNLYSTTGSAPSPIKNNQHISNNGSYSAAPLSPASSLVNNHSPPPPVSSAGCGLLSNQPMFHYTPAPSHLYNGSNLDAHMSLPHHHHIHPMYAHHTSTSMLMEAQPLNLSKKSSAPITPPISPSNIKLES